MCVWVAERQRDSEAEAAAETHYRDDSSKGERARTQRPAAQRACVDISVLRSPEKGLESSRTCVKSQMSARKQNDFLCLISKRFSEIIKTLISA